MHSWAYFSCDPMSIFKGAMAIILTDDEVYWDFSQFLETTTYKRHFSFTVKIIGSILLKPPFDSYLSVPLPCSDRLRLTRNDHGIHASTWSKVVADCLFVLLPIWPIHHPYAKIS